MCRTHRFRWNWRTWTEGQLLNTPLIIGHCRLSQRRTSITYTDSTRRNRTHCTFREHEGGGLPWRLPPRLRDNMATGTVIALDPNCYLPMRILLSRILITMDQSCWYHVINGIDHGWVCICYINSLYIVWPRCTIPRPQAELSVEATILR